LHRCRDEAHCPRPGDRKLYIYVFLGSCKYRLASPERSTGSCADKTQGSVISQLPSHPSINVTLPPQLKPLQVSQPGLCCEPRRLQITPCVLSTRHGFMPQILLAGALSIATLNDGAPLAAAVSSRGNHGGSGRDKGRGRKLGLPTGTRLWRNARVRVRRSFASARGGDCCPLSRPWSAGGGSS